METNKMDYEKLWKELENTLQDEYKGTMKDVSYSALDNQTFEVFESLVSATNTTHVLSLMKYLEKKGKEQ